MRIRCKSRREGAAPLEAVVTISTAHGRTEEVIVHRGLVDEGGLEVYYIGEQENLLLIELPHQAMSGRWRVWVPKSAVA